MNQETDADGCKDVLLTEYVQLREELRLYLARKRGFEVVLALIAALVGISVTLTQPIPLLLMSFLPVFLIDEQTRRLDAIHRIASYIRSQIEPKIKGLKWETFGNRFLGDSSHFSFSVHGLDVVILSLLSVIQFCVAAAIWRSNSAANSLFNYANEAWLLPIGGILILSLIGVIMRFHSIKPRGQRYVEKWQQIAEDEALGTSRDES